MKNEDIVSEIFAFLNKTAGVELENVSLKDGLELDLGITGDDAYDLISAFSTKFNVDISRFIFAEYFHAEPSVFSFKQTKKNKELTIQKLLEAVISKTLE